MFNAKKSFLGQGKTYGAGIPFSLLSIELFVGAARANWRYPVLAANGFSDGDYRSRKRGGRRRAAMR